MIIDNVTAEVLQGTMNKEEMKTITCQGNETKLANCSIGPATLSCHSVLVHCYSRSRQGSGEETPVCAVVGAVIAVLVVGVGVVVLVVVISVIWWKKHLKPGNTRFAFYNDHNFKKVFYIFSVKINNLYIY